MIANAETRWVLRPGGKSAAPDGSEFPPLVERILAQRGFTDPEARRRFLQPKLSELSDPFLLPQMDLAVERVLAAIDAGERITLFGDYDVDGVTSLTLLKQILDAFGGTVATFLPHRMDEGYGISREGLDRCLDEHSPQLLIAVDCGTTSIDEIAWLNERGIDSLILDHHELSERGRPDCVALVNPKCGDDYHYLCSAGVVFKLAHALLKTRSLDSFALRDFLDVVAVGTVADIVPLVGENRVLVRRGLHELESSRIPGLRTLAIVAGCKPPFDSVDVGFRIGPRLNAAGRLESAREALDLMLAEDDNAARPLAESLDRRNRERRDVELRIRREVENALTEFDPERQSAIVLGSRSWHPGVVGIVASRIAGRFHRPTFIVAFDENGVGKGSGRSIPGISLVDALNQCRDLILKGGGHEMAAGVTIEQTQLDAFRERLDGCIRESAVNGELEPKLQLDTEVDFHELDFKLLRAWRLLEPFGSDNREPLLLARGVQPAAEPRLLKDAHYSFRLRQKGVIHQAIYFNGAETPLPRPPWDIAFRFTRNDYRGQVSIQLQIQSMRTAQPA